MQKIWLTKRPGAIALALLLLTSAPATADDRTRVLELQAGRLARAGQCEELIALLDAAPDTALGNGELGSMRGQCEIRLGRYAEARESLLSAKRDAPGLPDVDLYLGVAQYHLEDFEGAERSLSAARGKTSDEAQLDLYTGLVLLRRAESHEAALALERARRSSPRTVEPMASYYAALAWQSVRDRDRARAALDRVRATDPGGVWAARAEEALLEGGRGGERFWASLTGGVEYDTNVVLRGTGVTLPSDISNEGDWRGVWGVEGGAELLRTENWSAGLLGSYWGSAHDDLKDFDSHTPTASAYLDRRFGQNDIARLRYDFAFSWVDKDPYLLASRGTASWLHAWENAGTTEIFVDATGNDFRFRLFDVPDPGTPGCLVPPQPTTAPPCGPSGLNEADYRDRDGVELGTGIEQRFRVADWKTTFLGGYRFTHYWADGDEWDGKAHGVHLGAEVDIPFDVSWDVVGSFTYRPFDNPSSFPVPQAELFSRNQQTSYPLSTKDREEKVYGVFTELMRPIGDNFSISARYSYTNVDSNVDVYEYDRHIVGTYITVYVP